MKPKIYIAHPFGSRKKMRRWQLMMEKKYGDKIEFVNPFYNSTSLEVFKEYDKNTDSYYKKLDYKAIVERDIELIRSCNIMVAVIDGGISYGTIHEMVYGSYNNMVLLICTNGHHNHPWLKYHSSKQFTSFKDLNKWIKENVMLQ